MDSLVRRRELITVVLLIAVAARLLALVIASLWDGAYAGGGLLSVAAVLAALWCGRAPATARAHPLLLLAVIAASLSVLLEFAMIVRNAVGVEEFQVGYLFAFLPDLVLPLLAVIFGIVALREFPHDVQASAGPTGPPPGVVLLDRPPLQQQPTWPSDQAAGAAWTTAGDAASGAPAAGWGAPDPQQPPGPGWQPIPGTRPDPPDWRRPEN